MIKAAIFDWDGTLADTRAVIVESFQKILSEIGLSADTEFIVRQIGISPMSTLKEILRAKGIKFDETILNDLIGKRIEKQLGMTAKVPLFDGAVDILDSLCGRVKNGLATMSERRIIDRQLKEKGLRKYFEVVIAADDVSKSKPDPEVFLKCASCLNVLPEDCVVFEDSIFGVKAAKAGGMKCIAVTTGAYSWAELGKDGADLLVASLTERDRIFGFLFD